MPPQLYISADSFGVLDAFAFVVFAVVIFVGVIILSIWANFQVSSRKMKSSEGRPEPVGFRLVGIRRL
jgi:hypothetical protein